MKTLKRFLFFAAAETFNFVNCTLRTDAQIMVKGVFGCAESSMEDDLINVNGVVFFVADDGTNGKELWKYTHTLDPGISRTSDDLLQNYTLSHNYLNPFNPNTKILFFFPHSSCVNLRVYDVIGREVGYLVNHKMNAGSYDVDFRSVNYSRGIYFYTIRPEHYVQTKNMILSK